MSQNGGGGKSSFFQRTMLLMSFFLILLFAAYEFSETPSQGFLAMKIIGFKEELHAASLTLFLSNDSSEKREGFLIVLLGYEKSRVSENATCYLFTDFKMLNLSILTLDPSEEKRLDLNLTLDSEAKRIVVVYCHDSYSSFQTDYRGLVVLRRDMTVWVQTWLG